uniref:Uncharacterized protein n=1 Tax=Arundo donax TaxID=35708 RepID=A0A0A9G6T8_ARUDO
MLITWKTATSDLTSGSC